MTDTRKSYSFIGNDCPPGYRRVGTIDVADPADVHSAQDKGYRIGTIYNGYSGSCAEPCAADIYERPLFEICDKTGEEPCGECHIQPGETCDICGASNPLPETNTVVVGIDLSTTEDTTTFFAHLPPQSNVRGAALADVAAERRRQIDIEGWTQGHDDAHSDGELARAASCYAYHGSWSASDRQKMANRFPQNWPWDRRWWKPKDARRDLVKAAALIIAEIERLDRTTEGHP